MIHIYLSIKNVVVVCGVVWFDVFFADHFCMFLTRYTCINVLEIVCLAA